MVTKHTGIINHTGIIKHTGIVGHTGIVDNGGSPLDVLFDHTFKAGESGVLSSSVTPDVAKDGVFLYDAIGQSGTYDTAQRVGQGGNGTYGTCPTNSNTALLQLDGQGNTDGTISAVIGDVNTTTGALLYLWKGTVNPSGFLLNGIIMQVIESLNNIYLFEYISGTFFQRAIIPFDSGFKAVGGQIHLEVIGNTVRGYNSTNGTEISYTGLAASTQSVDKWGWMPRQFDAVSDRDCYSRITFDGV